MFLSYISFSRAHKFKWVISGLFTTRSIVALHHTVPFCSLWCSANLCMVTCIPDLTCAPSFGTTVSPHVENGWASHSITTCEKWLSDNTFEVPQVILSQVGRVSFYRQIRPFYAVVNLKNPVNYKQSSLGHVHTASCPTKSMERLGRAALCLTTWSGHLSRPHFKRFFQHPFNIFDFFSHDFC